MRPHVLLILLLTALLPSVSAGHAGQAPSGRWVYLHGPDGGDMHFVYVASSHTVFASHGFGGVWRSVDGGATWTLTENPGFLNTNFQAMAEVDGVLIAGGNNGLWISDDDGVTWSRLSTGDPLIDSWGNYEVVSIVPLSRGHILFSVMVDRGAARMGGVPPRHGFYELRDGNLVFHELPVGGDADAVVMLGYDGEVAGDRILFVASSEAGLYTYSLETGSWGRILDKRVTRVYVDASRGTVYVGTVGDWYYIGVYGDGGWRWEHVAVPGKRCAVATFIRPDPYNPHKLWIGAVGTGRGSPYKVPEDVGQGDSFIGVGFWFSGSWVGLNITGNWAPTVAIDVHGEGEDEDAYTMPTRFGRVARYAYVPQAGRGNIKKTEDGGNTWRPAHRGLGADTMNMLTYLASGVRRGDIVVTCVSGTQILKNLGEGWEEGVDFTIGDVGGGLPGYSWGAASPEEPLMGRYDLLIATGYPPRGFTGNGVYAVDTACLKSGGGRCVARLTDKPAHSLLVVGHRLYIGRMDSGVDVLDLDTMELGRLEGIPEDEAGIDLLYIDGRLFVATEKGGDRDTDNYFFSDRRSTGGLYVCTGGSCEPIYTGRRVVGFSVHGESVIMLTNRHELIYMEDYRSGRMVVSQLPADKYSSLAVDWGHGVAFISTFNPKTPGVYYTYIDQLTEGEAQLHPFTNGLLTNWVRQLLLIGDKLFAGTEGMSVWMAEISYEAQTTTSTTQTTPTATPTAQTTTQSPTPTTTQATPTPPPHTHHTPHPPPHHATHHTSRPPTPAATTTQRPTSSRRNPLETLTRNPVVLGVAVLAVAALALAAAKLRK